MTAIDLGYRPRDQFVPFHLRKQRWAVLVAHRRAGKTVACIADLIDAALRSTKDKPRFAYVAPFYVQAKMVAWDYVHKYAGPIPGATFNESELKCTLPNGAVVQLFGADNYNRMRGIYLDGVILDENGDMDPRAWAEVIRPALADRAGWAVFIGTPRGRNEFAEKWDEAKKAPDEWFGLMLRASETGLLPQAELDDARKSMTSEQYDAEFECSFDAGVLGGYFTREMADAEKDNRIGNVPWERGALVHTAWDLGIGDSTAIWFAQLVGKEVRLIDYVESSGVGLDWYVKALRDRPYVYGTHLLPHDVEIHELGSGKRRVDTLQELGLSGVRVLERERSVDDGINAARLLLPRVWFDVQKCERGIRALQNYRREFDDKLKVFKDRPLHDWCSHGADALRYLARGIGLLGVNPNFNRKIEFPVARYA